VLKLVPVVMRHALVAQLAEQLTLNSRLDVPNGAFTFILEQLC